MKPYVFIKLLLAALSWNEVAECRVLKKRLGKQHKSEPESIRNCFLVFWSATNKQLVDEVQPDAATDCLCRFPDKEENICVHSRQNGNGTITSVLKNSLRYENDFVLVAVVAFDDVSVTH